MCVVWVGYFGYFGGISSVSYISIYIVDCSYRNYHDMTIYQEALRGSSPHFECFKHWTNYLIRDQDTKNKWYYNNNISDICDCFW